MAMRKRLGLIVGILLAATIAPAFAAQPTEQQVRQLMDVIGLGKSLSQMNAQVATSMQQALPCVSSNYWQRYIDENSSKDFIGRLVPVYQKHFTADEVDGMVKFYSSPLGQKVLTEMPLALSEANQAGQQWGHEHTQQMISKLVQAGTLGTDGRCPATAFARDPASSASTASADSSSSDEAVPAAVTPVAVPEHAASSRRHGHVPVKKHTTTKKKAVPAKKTVPAKKGVPAKATTPAKTATKPHTTTQKPASDNQKTAPASQGT